MKAEKEYIDDLIVTFLTNGLEENALNELKEWIAASSDNEKYFMQLQEIWFSATQENKEQYNKEEAFELFRKRVKEYQLKWTVRKGSFGKVFFKYAAAILVLGLVSYFSYWNGENKLKNALTRIEVEAPVGSQTKLRLPDGTQVVLNAGSFLSYPQDFGVYNREVDLQGEGYFEVVHNREIPFNVRTKELQVRVLGTKFNFKNYLEDKEAVVSLFEGKVALKNKMQREAELIMLPDERVTLNKKDGVMKKESIVSNISIQWVNGRLSFDEIPLRDVTKTLERSYGVRIKFANDSLRDLRFYGNFSRAEQSIKDVLEALSATEKVHYT